MLSFRTCKTNAQSRTAHDDDKNLMLNVLILIETIALIVHSFTKTIYSYVTVYF